MLRGYNEEALGSFKIVAERRKRLSREPESTRGLTQSAQRKSSPEASGHRGYGGPLLALDWCATSGKAELHGHFYSGEPELAGLDGNVESVHNDAIEFSAGE